MYAGQATLNPLTLQLENLNARVMDAECGEPVGGMVVKFYLASGRAVGTAVTNGRGVAVVNSPLSIAPSTVQALLGGGYYADAEGNGTYGGAQGHGSVELGTV
ncbi:hypothetical protein [Streptomyces luteireticuli]|uniref:hypothetical protein n=1 Tax=Streptomyces luteireticuli TaxID=173858 RepID=UPI00355868D4